MIEITDMLARLQCTHQTGEGRWSARCPAHEDKSPSLSLRLAADKWLLFCHAGCDVDAILAALGLTWGDICPEREVPLQRALAAGHRRQRRALAEIPAGDYARWVLRLAASDLERGLSLSLSDRAAIALAKDILTQERHHG